ncbi:MAG: DUF4292 domain-containing protein [Duncaniella sp.]|nr:DUF4292 domain-containing protein [Duncaniella sp.]
MRLRYLFITLITLGILTLSSCGSGKHTAGNQGYENINPDTVLDKKELNALFSSLTAQYGNWKDVKVPVKVRLKSPTSFNISGNMTMVKDESISMSLRFFGMEVASFMVTTDSVFALYKMDKIYMAEDISKVLNDFPAAVGNLQSLLMGHAFQIGEYDLQPSRCSLAGTGREWLITPGGMPAGISYEFAVALPSNRVRTMSVTIPDRRPIVASYSDYQTTPSGTVAGVTDIVIETEKAPLNMELEFNYGKAEWNAGDVKRFNIPQGYRRVTKTDIFKMFKSKTGNH